MRKTLKERQIRTEGQGFRLPRKEGQTLQQAGPCPIEVLAPKHIAEYLERRRHEAHLVSQGKKQEKNKVLF